MQAISVEMMVPRIIRTLEEDIIPNLTDPFLRGEAFAILGMLSNLAARIEERCDVIEPENQGIRAILRKILEEAGHASMDEGLRRTLEEALAVEGRLGEANIRLKEALVQVIRALPRWGLAPEKEAALTAMIHQHLRNQLNRDLALRQPTRIGRISKGR